MNLILNRIVNCWSKESGRSIELAIEDVSKVLEIDRDFLEKNVRNAPYFAPFTGTEIANHLEITRQDASQTLKRALRKVFHYLKKTDSELSDFEIASYMAQLFHVDNKNQKEIKKFFKLFPKDIKRQIKNTAMELVRKDGEVQVMSELL